MPVAPLEEMEPAVIDRALSVNGDGVANITATDVRCDGGYCVQGHQPRT